VTFLIFQEKSNSMKLSTSLWQRQLLKLFAFGKLYERMQLRRKRTGIEDRVKPL